MFDNLKYIHAAMLFIQTTEINLFIYLLKFVKEKCYNVSTNLQKYITIVLHEQDLEGNEHLL